MTTRVTVTHDDESVMRPVSVQVFSRSTDIEKYPEPAEPHDIVFIGPGRSAQFVIHKYQYLVIKE